MASTPEAGGIGLRINGDNRTASAPPATPLLYVLRNDFGLRGTRFGCGTGHCGACTVQLDGKAVTSCDTPLWACAGKSVTTIEGIGNPEEPHPIQRAFLELQAAQCGYCINGIIMRSKALLEQRPAATDQEIRQELDRHLCRCGSHLRILLALRRAAAEAAGAAQ